MLGELGVYLRLVAHRQAQDLRMYRVCGKRWSQRQMAGAAAFERLLPQINMAIVLFFLPYVISGITSHHSG